MPKLPAGRLDGLDGMNQYSAEHLHEWADELEAQIGDPNSDDDPRYLLRWARKIRRLAEKKERSVEHKKAQR